jgi:hypothetical protein
VISQLCPSGTTDAVHATIEYYGAYRMLHSFRWQLYNFGCFLMKWLTLMVTSTRYGTFSYVDKT